MSWVKRLPDCPAVSRHVKYHGWVLNPAEKVIVAVFGHDDYDDDQNKLVYRIDPLTGRRPKPGYHVDFVIRADCTVFKYRWRFRFKWSWTKFDQKLRDSYGQEVIRRIREAFGKDAQEPCGSRH